MTNGNGTNEYKIAQVNTGNGKWTKNDLVLLSMITRQDPDIIVISESNFETIDPIGKARREFIHGYNLIDKVFMNSTHARLSVLIKEGHNHRD